MSDITDEDIRELLEDRDPTTPRLTITDLAWCLAALRIPIGKLASVSRAKARAKCVEIINTRAQTAAIKALHCIVCFDVVKGVPKRNPCECRCHRRT